MASLAFGDTTEANPTRLTRPPNGAPPAPSPRGADETTTATGSVAGKPLKFGDNLGTHYEGLAIALLGSCSTENDARIATKERWEKALSGDHLRVRFAKPRVFLVTGENPTADVEEILVPVSPTDHVFIRKGDTYRAFAKFDPKTCGLIQESLKQLGQSR
jgi:hypothetical protein